MNEQAEAAVQRMISVLVEVTDFFPGDAEACAIALLPVLSDVWDEGYEACEDFHHGHGGEVNGYGVQSTEGEGQ